MMTLRLSSPYFLGDAKKQQQEDLCLHGYVLLMFGEDTVSDNKDWCVSAAALRFMRSILQNHFSGNQEHMLPCCGHTIIPAEDKQTVEIIGCDNGIDFDILHTGDKVKIVTEAKTYTVPFSEYRDTVLAFAAQVENVYQTAPARIISDAWEQDGFTAFWNEWKTLKARIQNNLTENMDEPQFE